MVDQPFGRLPPEAHHDDIVHRFGRVQAFAAAVDPETIAAEAEFADVAPAIGEKLADPNRSGDNLVPAFRAVALGIDLVIAREVEPCADALQRYQRIELTRLSDSETVAPQLCKPVAVVGVAK